VGTILWQSHPWADALRRRPDVSVMTVTLANRETLLDSIIQQLKVTQRT
jgi:nucleoside-triphosphatase THEP1